MLTEGQSLRRAYRISSHEFWAAGSIRLVRLDVIRNQSQFTDSEEPIHDPLVDAIPVIAVVISGVPNNNVPGFLVLIISIPIGNSPYLCKPSRIKLFPC